ncbi:aspartate dehydrogenase [Ruegeria sp. 6PALISEP08]|uniref:aspartate dehydrogenase n=1 Tax=Ruegeria sp. 6PALISEP08 TaxID=1225660 RepID=UPI00067EEEC4|nr:aspartate dehydrogenase [Ruegeria sp. 6PALISEP08]
MKIAVIGTGAIAQYVQRALPEHGHELAAILVRPHRVASKIPLSVGSIDDLPAGIDMVLDCAGHEALAGLGPYILANGMDIISVSVGALADQKIADRLESAARQGGGRLHLASGAIGGLDCLSAAAVGPLKSVTYVGRKPPAGWKGSLAEHSLELDKISDAETHFQGSAREAALAYPKNANVAAAVALAGVGFDDTQVRLIADPTIYKNIHEVEAEGDFGTFQFRISGTALPDNPRSSALAAMSVLSKLDQLCKPIVL